MSQAINRTKESYVGLMRALMQMHPVKVIKKNIHHGSRKPQALDNMERQDFLRP